MITGIVFLMGCCFALFVAKNNRAYDRTLLACSELPNELAGTHAHASLTYSSEEAFAEANLLVKQGSADGLVAMCGAGDDPLGICNTECESGEQVGVFGLSGGMPGTVLMVASDAVSAGERVFTADAGQVSELSASAGDYYLVGRTVTAGDVGDEIEVLPCFPEKVTVS